MVSPTDFRITNNSSEPIIGSFFITKQKEEGGDRLLVEYG
jgi:hypothetical protein